LIDICSRGFADPAIMMDQYAKHFFCSFRVMKGTSAMSFSEIFAGSEWPELGHFDTVAYAGWSCPLTATYSERSRLAFTALQQASLADTGAEGCCSVEYEAADAQAGACLRSTRSKFFQGKENIVCFCLSFGPSTFGMPCSCLLVDDNLTSRLARDQSGLRDQNNEANLLDHKFITYSRI
jgi:hypothetical protein